MLRSNLSMNDDLRLASTEIQVLVKYGCTTGIKTRRRSDHCLDVVFLSFVLFNFQVNLLIAQLYVHQLLCVKTGFMLGFYVILFLELRQILI